MDKATLRAIENEHDYNQSMDLLTAELRDLGVDVDIPYGFCDLPLYEGHETIEEYEAVQDLLDTHYDRVQDMLDLEDE